MQAVIEITPWHWVIFISGVILFLMFDLGVFHRHAHAVKYQEALVWTFFWFGLAMLFAGGLAVLRSRRDSLEFLTGYFIEVSLSLDNIFVIALIVAYFKVSAVYQHRLLFWGVLGALVMRGVMIWLGVELISRFDWILYVFGAFILFTGVKMFAAKGMDVDPGKSMVVRAIRKLFSVSPEFDGQKFFTRLDGRWMMTPLFLALLLVETADLFFAVDSIPAIFGVTRQPFIVFTSNIFAVLGLRSLYFVVAGAMGSFRFLKAGLSIVLVFIGVKMLIDPHDHPPRWFQWDIPDGLALVVVILIIAVAVLASMIAARREAESRGPKKPGSPP